MNRFERGIIHQKLEKAKNHGEKLLGIGGVVVFELNESNGKIKGHVFKYANTIMTLEGTVDGVYFKLFDGDKVKLTGTSSLLGAMDRCA